MASPTDKNNVIPTAELTAQLTAITRQGRDPHGPTYVSPSKHKTYAEAAHTVAVNASQPDTIIGMSNQFSPDAQRLQQELRKDGYLKGPADGKFGPQTLASLHAYQDAHHMPRSDTFNMATLNQPTQNVAVLARPAEEILSTGRTDFADGARQWLSKPGLPGTNLSVTVEAAPSTPRYPVAAHSAVTILPTPSVPKAKAPTIQRDTDGGRGNG